MSTNDRDDEAFQVSLRILEGLSCPRALTVAILLRHREWSELLELQTDPLAYKNAEDFFRAYQATKLLSKAEWLPTGINTESVAKRKFEEAEERCKDTNLWFSAKLQDESRKGPHGSFFQFRPDHERALLRARGKIARVLGHNMYSWINHCGFGPGADTTSVKGLTAPYYKLSEPGKVTQSAEGILNAYASLTRIRACIGLSEDNQSSRVEITEGNRVTFVPKNAKTDRTIAIEPRWNMFLQKGLGRFLRNRLKLFGVDLDDQRINRGRARIGSLTGAYATIDLSAASDTISKRLIQYLLPEKWVDIFACLRSPRYFLNGKWSSYHKWSSMGNGYTFELESLVFWALCTSIHPDCTVYGDDLVVPVASYVKIVALLELCGFSCNSEKSFHQGPFRESCGGDYFLGKIVTPIYFKKALDGSINSLTLVNQISVLSSNLSAPAHQRDRRFYRIWRDLVHSLPKRLHLRGPQTISTCVHDEKSTWTYVALPPKWGSGWDGHVIRTPVAKPVKVKPWEYEPAVAAALLQPFSDGFSIRGRWRWKEQSVFVPRGTDALGPWVF